MKDEKVTIIEAKEIFNRVSEPASEDDSQSEAPSLSEDAIALKFSAVYGDDLRYVAPWGRWLIWNGKHWTFDETVKVYDLARRVCRDEAERCEAWTEAKKIASAKTRAAVENLARADRRHAATVDQWDADPWLLNTPAGVVDLRTGDMHPHRHEQFCTKITATSPGGDCPRWIEFLRRITDGNQELQDFLRRVIGYGLTGLTREHALFFAHGTGANGKSVFLNTLAGVAGDYHRTAPMETFIVSHTDRQCDRPSGHRRRLSAPATFHRRDKGSRRGRNSYTIARAEP